jgi:hypothetical protein
MNIDYEYVKINPNEPRIHMSNYKIDKNMTYEQEKGWEIGEPHGLWCTLKYSYMDICDVKTEFLPVTPCLYGGEFGRHFYNIIPKKDNNILQLRTVEEYKYYWDKYKIYNEKYKFDIINYKKLAEDYDGIECYLTPDVPDEIRFMNFQLSDFGCIWNLNAIDIVELENYIIYDVITFTEDDTYIKNNKNVEYLCPKGVDLIYPFDKNITMLNKAVEYDLIDVVDLEFERRMFPAKKVRNVKTEPYKCHVDHIKYRIYHPYSMKIDWWWVD